MFSIKKNKKAYLLMGAVMAISVLILVMNSTEVLAAPSWRPEDTGIYAGAADGNAISSLLEQVTSAIGSFLDGLLNVLFAPFITLIGNILYSILLGAGISIDAIVYGRVGGASALTDNIAFYTFELQDGNIYGTIAIYAYNIFMSIFTVVLIVLIIYRLCALLYLGADGKSRNELKEILWKAVFMIMAMYAMPKFIDLLLYIRDVVLYTIRTGGVNALAAATGQTVSLTNVFGFGDQSIISMYSKAATFNVVNAAIFLAVNVYTLYLAANYISIALTFAIMIVIFPLVCVMETAFRGNKLRDWFMEIVALLMVPVIDAILLLFPVIIMMMGDSGETAGPFTLLRFIMVMSVIPARNFVRQKLGLGQASAMEGVGVGAALGAMQLGRSLAKGISRVGQNLNEKKREAATQEELAETDKLTMAHNEAAGKEKVAALETSIKERLGKNKGKAMLGADGAPGTETMADVDGYKQQNYTALQDEMEQKQLSGTQKNARLYEAAKTDMANMENAVSRLNGRKRANREMIDQLTAANKALEKEKKGKAPGDTAGNLGIDRSIRENEAQIAALKSENNDIDNRINEFRQAQSGIAQTLGEFEKMGANIDLEKIQSLDNRANIANFERPEMLRNISPERRAELRAQKADMLRAQARTRAIAGYSAMATGALVGGSSGMFLGGSAATAFSVAGIEIQSAFTENSLDAMEFKQAQTGIYAHPDGIKGFAGSMTDAMRSGSMGLVNMGLACAAVSAAKSISGRDEEYIHVNAAAQMQNMYEDIALNYDSDPRWGTDTDAFTAYEDSRGFAGQYGLDAGLLEKHSGGFSQIQEDTGMRYADFAGAHSQTLIMRASALMSDAVGRIDTHLAAGNRNFEIDIMAEAIGQEYYNTLVGEGILSNPPRTHSDEYTQAVAASRNAERILNAFDASGNPKYSDDERTRAENELIASREIIRKENESWDRNDALLRETVIGNVTATVRSALNEYAEHTMTPEDYRETSYRIYGNIAPHIEGAPQRPA